jgi:DNA-directed RNA polymerase subunit RPC12/RpoP
MSFYILQNDQTKGPYTIGQLRSMWSNGAITGDTFYCKEGYGEWLRLRGIADQLESVSPVAQHMSKAAPALSPQTANGGGIACPHCGSHSVGKVRGLQGFGEVSIDLILCFLCLIPGIVYYIYMESVPYCSGCGRRVRR